ncbi:GGDEF domain-containing protein [Pseudomonas sp. M30-35]|uniref:GGDEF domain-containing protein n=1 Tax=Pseudomonas sp. M30-35 TaxID=1981174 RepID=UPI000B3D42CC|nr:GGDEF domain-containing protein [Pseudomonas sp. M30-35]ARU86534.1 GGDEF domain-containing protein [Pseudomonas sp. M30-35]
MSTDADHWKDKYLSGLEQQEKLERSWDMRLDLLRRGLVRSSLAAEGADKAVDQCMQDLRAVLRKNDIDAGLSNLIPHLERTVLESEKQRKKRAERITAALTALVDQLFRLEPPREVSKPLKAFAKKLERSYEHSSELPGLLTELSRLQQQTLAALENKDSQRPGLLQRLFGNPQSVATAPAIANAPQESNDALPAPAPSHASAAQPLPPAENMHEAVALVEPSATLEPEPEQIPEPLTVATQAQYSLETADSDSKLESEQHEDQPAANELAPAASEEPFETAVGAHTPAIELHEEALEPIIAETATNTEPEVPVYTEAQHELAPPDHAQQIETTAQQQEPEPVYSAIADHVEATLLDLLAELPLPEHHQSQAEALSTRIRAGLNMYELVPVLDDLAVLMRVIADVGQREFEGYLKQLNERLAHFQGSLKETHEGYVEAVNTERALDTELREQVDGLNVSVQEATDLSNLKGLVENRLSGLLGTMEQYQSQRDERERQVTEHLQALVERVASMEQEATGFRQHMEEQRQKALIDPLTGLPNRAAWGERLEIELARWQRYNGHLLLAIIDIDHFKRINDDYGHLAGDKVLKIIAGELQKRMRKSDFIARFGGEEFVVLLPSTPLEGGLQLLETLRSAIEKCPFHFKGEPVTITLSAGISAFAEDEPSDEVFERADQALYRAKNLGRNRVEQG